MQEEFAGGFQLALLWQGVVLEAFNMVISLIIDGQICWGSDYKIRALRKVWSIPM
jgi:hypothetical protein